jgi:hypothetical protein
MLVPACSCHLPAFGESGVLLFRGTASRRLVPLLGAELISPFSPRLPRTSNLVRPAGLRPWHSPIIHFISELCTHQSARSPRDSVRTTTLRWVCIIPARHSSGMRMSCPYFSLCSTGVVRASTWQNVMHRHLMLNVARANTCLDWYSAY